MPAPNIEQLEQLLKIDNNDLEEERRTQHDKFYTVNKRLALAISRRDYLKKTVKEMDARLSEEIRAAWDAEQDGRLTEKICADNVLLHPDMINVTEDLLKAEKRVGLWWALKDAFADRGTALEYLIKMYLSEHYGEVRMENAGRPLRSHEAEEIRRDWARQRAYEHDRGR
jgi:hypothetical protein